MMSTHPRARQRQRSGRSHRKAGPWRASPRGAWASRPRTAACPPSEGALRWWRSRPDAPVGTGEGGRDATLRDGPDGRTARRAPLRPGVERARAARRRRHERGPGGRLRAGSRDPLASHVRQGPRRRRPVSAHGGVRRDGDRHVGAHGRGVAGDRAAAVEAAGRVVQRQRLLHERRAAQLVRELRAPHAAYDGRVRHLRPRRGPGRRPPTCPAGSGRTKTSTRTCGGSAS